MHEEYNLAGEGVTGALLPLPVIYVDHTVKSTRNIPQVRSTDKSMEVEDHCCQRMSTSQCSQQGYIYI